jgi:hypothetical protein
VKSEFKHRQIYADLLVLYQMYCPMHCDLPKAFRMTIGRQSLDKLTTCLREAVWANPSEKTTVLGRNGGTRHVQDVRAGIDVIRGSWLQAWKLKLLSHGGLAVNSKAGKYLPTSRQMAAAV